MRSKPSFLGICVLAFALTAVFAGTAHATSWIVLNSEGKALETLKATIQSEAENKKVSLLTRFLGIGMEFRCTTAALVGASIEAEGKITSGFKALFTGCQLYVNGALDSECTPRSTGKAAGTVETNALKGSLVLSEVNGPIKVEPKEGTSFVTLNFGVECPIFENTTINGVFYLQDGQYLLSKHLTSHLVEESFGTEIWISTKTAEHLSQVDGSAIVSLTGAHAGLKWGGPEDLPHKPTWLVLEEKGGEPLKKLKATLQIKNAESTMSLLTKMLGIKVQIRCSGSELSGGSLEPEGKATGLKGKFTGCELLNSESGKTIEECIPRTKGMSAGVVETAELKAEISGESVKVVPASGTQLALLEWGSGCLLAAQIPVSGTLYVKDAEGKFGEHLVTHSANQASGSELWVGQVSAEHLETSVDGIESVFLSGTHSGLKWGGMS